jgi:subtilase family serine protease
MRFRSRSSVLPFLALSVLAVAPSCSTTSPEDGPPGADTDAPAAPAAGSKASARPAWATPERFTGRVAGGELVSVQVHLELHNQAAADEELARVSDPASPSFGQYLTTEEFDLKYAPSGDDVAAVRAHLEAHGLRVGYVPGNRLFVSAQGTAAQVEAAFSTRLGLYRVGDRDRRAPLDEPSLPDALAARVSGTLGLSESVYLAPHAVTPGGVRRTSLRKLGPAAGATDASQCSTWFGAALDDADPAYGGGFADPVSYAPCGYTPPKLRAAYGFDDAVRSGNDGRGVKIAIIDAYLSPTLVDDARTYAAQRDPDYPLGSSQLTTLAGPITGPTTDVDPGWFAEATLDVEAAHAMAPGASLLFVAAASPTDQDLVAAVNLVAEQNLATIISNSYGHVEGMATNFVVWQAAVTHAGLKGVGVYFASGDNGDDANLVGYPSPGFPASLPNVTAVGGTSLALDQTNRRLFEVGWETAASFLVPGTTTADAAAAAPVWSPAAPGMFVFGSGGGTSKVYPQPAYQAGVVPASLSDQPGAPARVVPDIAMLADPMTGFVIGQTTSGAYGESAVGGTSLACPLFAGVMALAEQHAGHTIGFANPQLYAASATGIRDVAPGGPQAVALPGGGIMTTFDFHGLSIHTDEGYDDVTGLGVPDGQRFLDAMK